MSNTLSEEYNYLDFQQLKNKLKELFESGLEVLENEDDEESLLSDLDHEVTHIDVIFKKMDEVYHKNE